jgi:hypothetical protein
MGYYAQKPPKRRDPYGADPHARKGLDPEALDTGWSCELAACLGWLACGWPCSFSVLAGLASLLWLLPG